MVSYILRVWIAQPVLRDVCWEEEENMRFYEMWFHVLHSPVNRLPELLTCFIKICNSMSDDLIMKRKKYGMNRNEVRTCRQPLLWHTRIVYFCVLILRGSQVYEACGTRCGSVCLRMRWKQITCNTVKCPISSTLCPWWWQGFLPHCICVLFCLKRDLGGFLSCTLLHMTEFAHSVLLIPICTAVGTIPA